MGFRKILFWAHLVSGVVAGVFIFFMSATGVLLTYEHHIIDAMTAGKRIEVPADAERLSVDEMAAIAREATDARAPSLSLINRADAPFLIEGRGVETMTFNPYTGEEVPNGVAGYDGFAGQMMRLHRWLGMEGESRKVGRAITGAANLAFLFAVVSGLYLWFPKAMKWPFIRMHLFFNMNPPTAKARDYNWHHVLGIWCLVPLFFIVISGVVMSYPWANAAVYRAFGEEPLTRRRTPQAEEGRVEDPADLASLQDAVDAAAAWGEGPWRKISFTLPSDKSDANLAVQRYVSVDRLPSKRVTLNYDRRTGEFTSVETYADVSAGRKARIFMRYVHTGEQYGILGGTIAGLASLGACFLAYTGMALSYRRLVLPLLRRRKAKA